MPLWRSVDGLRLTPTETEALCAMVVFCREVLGTLVYGSNMLVQAIAKNIICPTSKSDTDSASGLTTLTMIGNTRFSKSFGVTNRFLPFIVLRCFHTSLMVPLRSSGGIWVLDSKKSIWSSKLARSQLTNGHVWHLDKPFCNSISKVWGIHKRSVQRGTDLSHDIFERIFVLTM